MTVQPTTWQELMANAFYDELADEHGPHVDPSPASSLVPVERRPVTNSTPPAQGVDGPATSFAPLDPVLGLTPRREDPRARASADGSAADANLPPITACICGLVVARPAHPWGYCGGGRACLERLIENEARRAVNADGPHTEPQEDSMNTKDTQAASWRNAA